METAACSKKISFSSFDLKVLGVIFMTFDHICYFLSGILPVPFWFSIIGRIAAPLFLFTACNGFEHTRSRKKYLLRLYLCMVIMSVVNIAENIFLPHPTGAVAMGNIFSTLTYLIFFLICIEAVRCKSKKKKALGILGMMLPFLLQFVYLFLVNLLVMQNKTELLMAVNRFILIFAPLPMSIEGGVIFLVLGIGIFLTKNNKVLFSCFFIGISLFFLAAALLSGSTGKQLFTEQCQWTMILSLPLLLKYNGEKGRGMKQFFYLYYPLHMLALLLLARAIA